MTDSFSPTPEEPRTYTIDQVAEILQVHRATVSRFIRSGELKVARLGHKTLRIRPEALDEFLRSREQPRPEGGE